MLRRPLTWFVTASVAELTGSGNSDFGTKTLHLRPWQGSVVLDNTCACYRFSHLDPSSGNETSGWILLFRPKSESTRPVVTSSAGITSSVPRNYSSPLVFAQILMVKGSKKYLAGLLPAARLTILTVQPLVKIVILTQRPWRFGFRSLALPRPKHIR